jgi:hypothetical protein
MCKNLSINSYCTLLNYEFAQDTQENKFKPPKQGLYNIKLVLSSRLMHPFWTTSGCPWPKATVKSPVGACRRQLWSPLWVLVTFGQWSLETAAARRRRLKFSNPDRGQKFVILSVTENVWSPCPAPTLPALPCPCEEEEEIEIPKSWLRPEICYSQRNWKCLVALPCPCPYPALPLRGGGGDQNSQILIAARNPLFST